MYKTVEYKYFFTDGQYESSCKTIVEYPVELLEVKNTNKINKYDIEVEDNHNYFVNDHLVHNCRVSLYWQDGEIKTASRGGQSYSSVDHLTKHPKLIEFFKNHPDYVLDGEAYKHGLSLQQISGLMRQEKKQSPIIEYYIYDIMDSTKTFEERHEMLLDIQDELQLSFNPEREWNEGDLKVQMVPHVKVSGWLSIERLHDKYVSEGWEGLVVRDPSKEYAYGARDKRMLKVKKYLDSEFIITGISEGLREEDMCFTLKTKEGKEFKAKPWGSRELKQDYRENINKLIGKMATVKYFYMSDDNVPLQPSVKCIRDYE